MLRLIALLAVFPATQAAPPQNAAPAWEQLKAFYDVQPVDNDKVKETDRQAAEGAYTEFSFPSEVGTAYGTFARPSGKGPFPLVIMIHGLGGNRQQMMEPFAKEFLKRGVAVMALDAPHHGERGTEQDKKDLQQTFFAFAMSKDQPKGLGAFMAQSGGMSKMGLEAIEQGVRDIRRALTWALRPEHRVDSAKIGAFGISLGAIMSSILSGVEPRINADLLVLGGDPVLPHVGNVPPDQALSATASAPSLFLPHSTAHVLMLNGYNDTVIPREDIERLYRSAPGTTLVFYDTPGDLGHGFGHSISREGYGFGIEWLVGKLSVPKPEARTAAQPAGG